MEGYNMNEIDIIEIDQNNRVKIFPEYDVSELFQMAGNVISLNVSRGYSEINQGERANELDALIDEITYNTGTARRELEDQIVTHLSRAGYSTRRVSLQGYSQGEWADVIVYGDSPLNSAIEYLQAIWRGDVYCLVHEVKHFWHDDQGNSLETWESVDSIGWIVADDRATIEQAIYDHFNLKVMAHA